ncbi:MAG: hypothetical protein HY303_03360 [Candidatus Wallbacteria bacterium]|nr:hypothetical protein [Candidatus Wallbacteria bacterium]
MLTILALAWLAAGSGAARAQEGPSFSGLSETRPQPDVLPAEKERLAELFASNGFEAPGEAETRWWDEKKRSGLTDGQLATAVLGSGSGVVELLAQQLRTEYLDRFGPPAPSPAEEAEPAAAAAANVSGDRKAGAAHWWNGLGGKAKAWGLRRGHDALTAVSKLPDSARRVVSRGIDRTVNAASWVVDLFERDAPMMAPSVESRETGGQWIAYQNGVPFPCFERQGARESLDLDGKWRFQRAKADHKLSLSPRDASGIEKLEREAEERHRADFDDSGWQERTVPCSDNKMNGTMGQPEDYEDGSWWRRRVTVPASWTGRYVKLVCYGAGYTADVWVNGKRAGGHEGGFTSWVVDVSALLRPGQSNTLAVRLDNVPWGSTQAMLPYAHADWFNYGGLYRDLYLEASDAVSVQNVFVRSARPDGTVVADALLYNRRSDAVTVTLGAAVRRASVSESSPALLSCDAGRLAGAVVASAGARAEVPGGGARLVKLELHVPDPRPWTPAMPNLYVLTVSSSASGGSRDALSTQFGLRTIAVDPAAPRLLLNGAAAPLLAGVARHEDHPETGRALAPERIKDDLVAIRDRLHANFVRTAHYPNHPLTYLMADRLGLAVWEEIPFYWVNHPNAYRELARRGLPLAMFREMVLRDYNRPSIWFWSCCNECAPIGPRIGHIRRLRQDLRGHYDDGRLVTQSAAADYPGPFDQSMAECDVAAWTLYFGIGFEARDHFKKNLDQTYAGMKEFLDKAHKHFPKKPILVSEFGYWANPDGGLVGDQCRFFDDSMRAYEESAPVDRRGVTRERGFVAGCSWWTAFDYFTGITGVSTFGAFQSDRVAERPLLQSLSGRYGPYTGWGR